MALKSWDNSFSVNYTTMDADHQKLIENINTLHEAIQVGQSEIILSQLVNDFDTNAQTHFLREEKYLFETKHPDFNAQQQQHKIFLNKVSDVKRSVDNGQSTLAITMLPFLNDWFLDHIMKTDMKYK